MTTELGLCNDNVTILLLERGLLKNAEFESGEKLRSLESLVNLLSKNSTKLETDLENERVRVQNGLSRLGECSAQQGQTQLQLSGALNLTTQLGVQIQNLTSLLTGNSI